MIDIFDKVYYICFWLIVDLWRWLMFCVIDLFVIIWLFDSIWSKYMIRNSGMYIYYLNKNACTCIILCVALWHHHDGNLCTSNSPLTTVSAGYYDLKLKFIGKRKTALWETLIPRPLVLIRDLALFLESEEKDLFEIKVLMVSLEYSLDDIFSVWPARDQLWVRVFCRYYLLIIFNWKIVRYLCAIKIYILCLQIF